MQALFNSCLSQQAQPTTQTSIFNILTKCPQPMKFKLVKTLNLLQPLLRSFALPHRQQAYKFPRKNLYLLTTPSCSIPLVYTQIKSSCPTLLIYCHGSGSTLNHVYDYCLALAWKFNISTVAYDYTGDGQSKKQFVSFQEDLKCVIAWAVRQGFDLRRVLLCGFSLGSYSALCLKGQMPRILISPICGLTSYVQAKPCRYQGEKFDNIGKALQIKSRVWLTHCTKQLIPIQHSLMLEQALKTNNESDRIQFTEIKDGYDHKSAPGYLFNLQGSKKFSVFIEKVQKQSKIHQLNEQTKLLKKQLLELSQTIQIKSSWQEVKQ